MKKVFLLINGNPPKNFPDFTQYDKIFCTDGAYQHLIDKETVPDVVVGDFDSLSTTEIHDSVEIIKRLDQNYTDFYKCLEIIYMKGCQEVEVYGSTGLEHDHFLGNLTVALQFKSRLKLIFLDDFSTFYFIPKQVELSHVKNRVISLFPFPKATQVNSEGLFYPLKNQDLAITGIIGTRNHAIKDTVKISYKTGDLLIFVSKYVLGKDELAYKKEINT